MVLAGRSHAHQQMGAASSLNWALLVALAANAAFWVAIIWFLVRTF